MMRETMNALLACLVTFLLCAVAYPAVVWGMAQLAFPRQAAGSLLYTADRTLIGSELIAQPFTSDRYFHPRPSAALYKADAAAGSNLGPKHPDLRSKMIERAADEKATAERPVPVDLVAASGSGLDPDISLQAASYQVGRVASARKIPEERVRGLIDGLINRSGSIIGAPERVNVRLLNLALDGVPIEE
jgi:potassium-transporting ATPase KdpC subunit